MTFIAKPMSALETRVVLVPCKCGNAVEFGVMGPDYETRECLVCGAVVSFRRPEEVDRARTMILE